MVESTEFLTKEEVHGKRNTKNKTEKKFERHNFDDEKDLVTRKAAGKKGHSRHYEEVLDEEFYEDDDYSDLIDWKKIK